MTYFYLLGRSVFAFVLLCASSGQAGETHSWTVFRPAVTSSLNLGSNKARNPNMETLGTIAEPLQSWATYGAGYTVSGTYSHAGTRSMQCQALGNGETRGASQILLLSQTRAKAIKLSGWSRALNVTGSVDNDYAVYLDILYADGTSLYGQAIPFSVGNHDWEYRERIVLPARPIAQISCYALFRGAHQGTVWFDDLAVSEIQDTLTEFDGTLVSQTAPSPASFDLTRRFVLRTDDDLEISLSEDGGLITSLRDGTNLLHAAGGEYGSGWFVCDRRVGSDWQSVGGWVTSTNDALHQVGVVPDLGLAADVWYWATNHSIRIVATVSNLVSADRALTLYFAVPVSMTHGWWWNTPRERVPLEEAVESGTLIEVPLGARNLVSQYPLGTLSGSSALTLSLPPDLYRPSRILYNRVTRQFYVAFDVGVSAITENFPQSVTVEVWLYRSDPAWGFRSGLAGHYERFPTSYRRSFTNEGTWVAFADVRKVPRVSDFEIAYHEIGYDPATVKADDTLGIPSFRYVSEPWSYWMKMPTRISNTSYAPVYNYLLTQHAQGNALATATLSSGVRDLAGNLEFFKAAEPWCPYGAAFYLNPSPFISDPAYKTSKFSVEWNDITRAAYQHPEKGLLDGEYIDSFSSYGTVADYATNHHRSTTFPLSYTKDEFRLMTPLLFGAYEMARSMGSEVHALGKPLIGNALFSWPYLPVGAGLFDFGGAEVNWFDAAGQFVSPADAPLLFARSLSGQRPYGHLLNTDFSMLSHASMETYMRVCAFYAIYPSAFSADASGGNYFEQPALYERDRDLFRKYVPIVRALSLAGWRPVTGANSSTSGVGVERYGGDDRATEDYLTLRNFEPVSRAATVTLEVAAWVKSGIEWVTLTNLFDGDSHRIDLRTGDRSMSVTLQPYECRAYAVHSGSRQRPRLLVDDPSFGMRPVGFGFEIRAEPGTRVIIERASQLGMWTPLQTNSTASDGLSLFIDSDLDGAVSRYYRARF